GRGPSPPLPVADRARRGSRGAAGQRSPVTPSQSTAVVHRRATGRAARARARSPEGSMTPLRPADIGTGRLGRISATPAAESPAIELVAVVDVDAEARDRVAAEVGTPGVADYRQLLGSIEGAAVATPTVHLYQVARVLLSAGL